jgi:ferredoxin
MADDSVITKIEEELQKSPNLGDFNSVLPNNEDVNVQSSTKDDSKVKMTIDQDVCIRCGSCSITYPDVFEVRSDGSSHPIDGVLVDRIKAEEMKLICPVEAIDLEELEI